jgi:hypothetical protein
VRYAASSVRSSGKRWEYFVGEREERKYWSPFFTKTIVTRGIEKCSYIFFVRSAISGQGEVVLPKIPIHE